MTIVFMFTIMRVIPSLESFKNRPIGRSSELLGLRPSPEQKPRIQALPNSTDIHFFLSRFQALAQKRSIFINAGLPVRVSNGFSSCATFASIESCMLASVNRPSSCAFFVFVCGLFVFLVPTVKLETHQSDAKPPLSCTTN